MTLYNQVERVCVLTSALLSILAEDKTLRTGTDEATDGVATIPIVTDVGDSAALILV